MDLESEDILITGGAGFVGSNLSRHLQDRGSTVHTVDNYSVGEQTLVPQGVNAYESDILDSDFKDIVQMIDPSVIIHLAAIHYIPYCNENPEETFQVNVMGTRNVLQAAHELDGLKGFVFSSSAAVYPPRNDPNPVDSATGPMDIYGETKLIGEDLVRLFAEDTGISTAVARLFNIYGPNETNPHLIPEILSQVHDGSRTIELGNTKPKRDFVHVSDVCKAIETMITNFDGQFNRYNVGTGKSISVETVVERISVALGETIDIVQDQDRVRESDRPNLEADISRIESDLGWHPEVEFTKGIGNLLNE